MLVVVLGIDPKDVLKMAYVDDEQVVKALGSDGPDESLRIGVRVRRPERSLKDLRTF